jgi:hypothetical protein
MIADVVLRPFLGGGPISVQHGIDFLDLRSDHDKLFRHLPPRLRGCRCCRAGRTEICRLSCAIVMWLTLQVRAISTSVSSPCAKRE